MKAGKRGEMNRCNYIGQMGESIAKIIFPCLEVTQRFEDKNGLDGRIEGKTIQVKADQRIEESGHIYHEYWEKSIGHPEQPWRRSPSPVDLYLFVTAGLYVYISANALAKREVGRQLKKILPTSVGILLPLSCLQPFTHTHPYWVSWEAWQQQRQAMRPMNTSGWGELKDGTNSKPGSVMG